MTKSRFIENFGPVAFTIGYGCSGGTEQGYPISDEYPGLLDGLVMGCSFPELFAGMVNNITDADLFENYLTNRATVTWSDAQIEAATGYPTVTTLTTIGAPNAVRVKAQGGTCNSIIPKSVQYDAKTNPTGIRCDIYDHTVNVFGRDPVTGFARRPIDNVGVQYGLEALNAGAISKQQFLDVNQNIGGYDNDGNYVTTRTVGDITAIQAAYDSGRVTYGGLGLRHTPIIDYRGYVDQPENPNEVHSRFHSFSIRQRLVDANGNFDNQVMLIENGQPPPVGNGLFSDTSPVLSHALTQMDEWLTNLSATTTQPPSLGQIQQAKPSDLVDACFTNLGTVEIAQLQVYQGDTTCNQLYPAFSIPKLVAGEPLENNVIKCQLKPIDPADYKVRFTAAELTSSSRFSHRVSATIPCRVWVRGRPKARGSSSDNPNGLLHREPVSSRALAQSCSRDDTRREPCVCSRSRPTLAIVTRIPQRRWNTWSDKHPPATRRNPHKAVSPRDTALHYDRTRPRHAAQAWRFPAAVDAPLKRLELSSGADRTHPPLARANTSILGAVRDIPLGSSVRAQELHVCTTLP